MDEIKIWSEGNGLCRLVEVPERDYSTYMIEVIGHNAFGDRHWELYSDCTPEYHVFNDLCSQIEVLTQAVNLLKTQLQHRALWNGK